MAVLTSKIVIPNEKQKSVHNFLYNHNYHTTFVIFISPNNILNY